MRLVSEFIATWERDSEGRPRGAPVVDAIVAKAAEKEKAEWSRGKLRCLGASVGRFKDLTNGSADDEIGCKSLP